MIQVLQITVLVWAAVCFLVCGAVGAAKGHLMIDFDLPRVLEGVVGVLLVLATVGNGLLAMAAALGKAGLTDEGILWWLFAAVGLDVVAGIALVGLTIGGRVIGDLVVVQAGLAVLLVLIGLGGLWIVLSPAAVGIWPQS
ncbi:MAG: hypothetical protein LBK95_00775 [Bifidobacteriaceae bacterium]|jgi:hypothetical protein|nr:hypothetical protein [Bifidobacteriaceae bacterium]